MTRGSAADGARATNTSVARAPFGVTADGKAVDLFTLTNASGIELRAMTYGAAIVSLRVPDRDGALDDVVLGYDDLAGYLRSSQYFGAIVGRYGNRIARGQFSLDGISYTLATNNGRHHLHGGRCGFDKLVWSASVTEREPCVVFELVSPHGDEGYPGRLETRVKYVLSERGEIIVDYWATTDRPTVVNLTQHSYFNLAGGRRADVLGHELTVHADHFIPADRELIPIGDVASVEGTPFDFRRSVSLGVGLAAPDEQLTNAGGYDHTLVLSSFGRGLAHAAFVHEPLTGRVLDVYTTEPGLQLYSGNFLDGSIYGKGGRQYVHRSGFCLETQHFPDSPNRPHFPSTVLRPGQEYRSRTVFAFGVKDGCRGRDEAVGA